METSIPLRRLPDGRTVLHSTISEKHLQSEIWCLVHCDAEGARVIRQRFRARRSDKGADEVFEKPFTLDEVFARGGPVARGLQAALAQERTEGARAASAVQTWGQQGVRAQQPARPQTAPKPPCRAAATQGH